MKLGGISHQHGECLRIGRVLTQLLFKLCNLAGQYLYLGSQRIVAFVQLYDLMIESFILAME